MGNGYLDKFPLLWEGDSIGELAVERESLYTWFDVRCRLPGEGLLCAWAVGEGGSLRLGVLEPLGREAGIRRRFSHRMTEPLGKLVRGEIRPAADGWEEWKSVPDPETVFRAPWLRKRLRGMEGALILRPGEGRRYLALPYDSKRPFPLPTLFCLASVRTLNGVRYAVFAFDEEERPVFQ